MSCYISSNENRFYAAKEQAYGYAASVTEANRLPAVRLTARQEAERVERRDKTGSRTFAGLPAGLRKRTSFQVTTYLTSWDPASSEPGYGPLFHAALGGDPLVFAGGEVSSISGNQLDFTAAHGLSAGQAVSCGGEIRFVTAVVSDVAVLLNAPFTGDQASGWPVDRTVTYAPASELPSVSIFDYWSPASSVHRILTGAAVDRMKVDINGDFHEFTFSGMASDLLDTASFTTGQAGLSEFPAEPAVTELNYSVIPGNLGQAWLGVTPDRFFTITGAEVTLENGLDLRVREFGLETPQCVAAGVRSVTTTFSLYEKPDNATRALYQAARQRSPLSVMFQLGQQPSQLCGVYLKSVIPEVPEFADQETRLEWQFSNCRAQGTIDDEIFVAFG